MPFMREEVKQLKENSRIVQMLFDSSLNKGDEEFKRYLKNVKLKRSQK